jgi:hypothetical protein
MNGSMMKWLAVLVIGVVAEVLVFAMVWVMVTGSADGLDAVGDLVAKVLDGVIPQ